MVKYLKVCLYVGWSNKCTYIASQRVLPTVVMSMQFYDEGTRDSALDLLQSIMSYCWPRYGRLFIFYTVVSVCMCTYMHIFPHCLFVCLGYHHIMLRFLVHWRCAALERAQRKHKIC